MALTKADIEHIAKLARLELTEKEKEQFAPQLSSILEYVEQLQKVDTSGCSYGYQVEGLVNSVAQDTVTQTDDDTRARLLSEMPDKAGDFLKVKGVFHS